MNTIIGPNNSGKSNVLRVLAAILGETWPTRPFSEKDIHGYDPDGTITVTVFFDAPLQSDPDVHGFRLSFSTEQETEYCPVNARGDPCTWPRGGYKRVTKDMRNEVSLLYLDLERQADKQLRASQWTFYGKLLKQIESSIQEADRQRFTLDVSAAVDAYIRGGLAAC